MDNFLNALQYITPAFGASTGDLERCRLLGMVDCGDRHKHIYQRAMLLVEQVKVSKGSPLVTCLLGGSSDSGKTALAATVGIDSDFPYVKIISAKSMIGLQESTKCALIIKIVGVCSHLSPVFKLDFSDTTGPDQTASSKGKKLMVIGTTSELGFLDSIGFCDTFSVTYHVPTLNTNDAKKVLEQLNVFADEDVDAAAEALNDHIQSNHQCLEKKTPGGAMALGRCGGVHRRRFDMVLASRAAAGW